jgi:hypothetical protein
MITRLSSRVLFSSRLSPRVTRDEVFEAKSGRPWFESILKAIVAIVPVATVYRLDEIGTKEARK